jgi:hypothetical protein
MVKVFVNYRRDDAAAFAARIRDRLAVRLGVGNVFMDVDSLKPGERFDQKLAAALAECDVFLAVFGARWQELFEERAKAGGRDFVREEIAAALERGIKVIPVTVDRAKLPVHGRLPADIAELVLHQKVDVTHERFGRDVDDLVQEVQTTNLDISPRTLKSEKKETQSLFGRWVRVGIVLSFLWVGPIYAYTTYTAVAPDSAEKESTQNNCIERTKNSFTEPNTSSILSAINKCDYEQTNALWLLRLQAHRTAAWNAFMPLPFVWCILFLVVTTGRWLRAGFASTRRSSNR